MIYINKRAVSNKSVTGVQRYLLEIEKYIDKDKTVSIYSPDIFNSGFLGYIWEQIFLPLKVKGVLWSPANLGPLMIKNQILTIHDISSIDHPEWFSRNYAFVNRILLPILIKRVKHIITVSEYSKNRIVSRFGVNPEKISVTYLAVSSRFTPLIEKEKDSVKKRLGLPERYVLSLGSLEPRKNIKLILESWRQWKNKPPGLKLVIAGGSSKIFSDAKIEDVPEDVFFTGRVLEEDLPGIYAAAEIFIYPSLYEGFGLPPLEAMSCGVPVIVSNSTSLPEVVGGAAVLIDPTSEADLCSAMDYILSDAKVSEKLIINGLERASKFSWQKTAKLTLEIIESKQTSNYRKKGDKN